VIIKLFVNKFSQCRKIFSYKEPEKVSREIVAKDRRGYELTARIAAFLLFFLLVVSVVLKDLHAGKRYVKDEETRGEVVTIALDAGHGGHDSGVTGPSGSL
jgi:N-acetylmuramoyl-L-alanine amidase